MYLHRLGWVWLELEVKVFPSHIQLVLENMMTCISTREDHARKELGLVIG